jgi:5-formyltetrahydrofolate cyclo-ligase
VPSDRSQASAELRSISRRARRELPDPLRRRAQASIVERLLGLPELSSGRRVGWYLATDGEVDLSDAARALVARGVELHLPVVGPDTSMHFAAWDPALPLRANRFGIGEPVHDPEQAVHAADLDAVVVPCVAVDPHGHRLGFGAGYYDRALRGADARRIGVVFEVQVAARIEPAPWDVPLDVVLTEAREIRPDAHDPG